MSCHALLQGIFPTQGSNLISCITDSLPSEPLLLPSRFSCVRLCATPYGSPPGSRIPGILQARPLEWGAISFTNAWKWKVKVKSLNRVRLLATPWTAAYQAPPSMGFSRQGCWSEVPLPSPSEPLGKPICPIHCDPIPAFLRFKKNMERFELIVRNWRSSLTQHRIKCKFHGSQS